MLTTVPAGTTVQFFIFILNVMAVSAAAIFVAATTAQTDALDGDILADEFAGIDTTASPDNDTVNVAANTVFAVVFTAVKN